MASTGGDNDSGLDPSAIYPALVVWVRVFVYAHTHMYNSISSLPLSYKCSFASIINIYHSDKWLS